MKALQQVAERVVVNRDWVVEATSTIELLEQLPTVLRDVRTWRDLSLREVSRETGIDASTLHRLERGVGTTNVQCVVAVLRWLTDVTGSDGAS